MICFKLGDQIRPYHLMCVMCSRISETNSHVFLYCEVARHICNRLFDLFIEGCVADLWTFLSIKTVDFGRDKEHKVLRQCATFASLLCIWMERMKGCLIIFSSCHILFWKGVFLCHLFGSLLVVSLEECLLWISKGIERLC